MRRRVRGGGRHRVGSGLSGLRVRRRAGPACRSDPGIVLHVATTAGHFGIDIPGKPAIGSIRAMWQITQQLTQHATPFWYFVTRFGEAQLLLPAALCLSAWVARRPEARPMLARWLAWMVVATLFTTVTKVAFIGWGVGSASWNFTGVSGHAMFAAAVCPMLLWLAASSRPAAWQRAGWIVGYALALLVALSRVMVYAHSVSEVVAGFLIGGTVSAIGLLLTRERTPPLPLPLWAPALLAAWLMLVPQQFPTLDTHGMVTRLSLMLSGRDKPYTRHDLLRDARLPRQSVPTTRLF